MYQLYDYNSLMWMPCGSYPSFRMLEVETIVGVREGVCEVACRRIRIHASCALVICFFAAYTNLRLEEQDPMSYYGWYTIYKNHHQMGRVTVKRGQPVPDSEETRGNNRTTTNNVGTVCTRHTTMSGGDKERSSEHKQTESRHGRRPGEEDKIVYSGER